MRKVKVKKKYDGKEGLAYHKELTRTRLKNDYIRNLINGRYYLARANMLAEQINSGNIVEKIDGATKTKEYMLSEYALMKMQAITSFRTVHFSKADLIKDYGMNEKDILELEQSYYDGKIIREHYDESDRKKTKAEFVNETYEK